MAEPLIVLSDRSRKIEFQRCPRARYLGYHIYGTGVQRTTMSIPLATGNHVHRGLESLLLRDSVDEAAKIVREGYLAEVKSRGLNMNEDEESSFVAYEQIALAEALVRAYAVERLPALLTQYDVLEVEKEDCETMLSTEGFTLDWQAKADSLLREKSSGDLYILSFKTAAGWDRRKDKENQHDDQGLSELWAVEKRLAGWWVLMNETDAAKIADKSFHEMSPFLVELLKSSPAPPEIQGIKMEFLIKGSRNENPKNSGRYVTYNHLIRAWRRIGIVPGEDSYAWRWEFPDPLNPEKKKRLSYKNWQPFNVWEEDSIGGIQGWIEMLKSGMVQPEAGDPFRSAAPEELRLNPGPVLFVTPVPYFRQPKHVEDWVEQVQWQEHNVNMDVRYAERSRESGDEEEYRAVLNRLFPQNRRACDWPSACQFQPICFEYPFGQDPRIHGDFQNRIPHHETELKRMEENENG